MAARFLLDTDILSYLIRHPQGRIAEWPIREGEGSVCTSIIVASELRFGVAKCGSPRLTAQLEAVLVGTGKPAVRGASRPVLWGTARSSRTATGALARRVSLSAGLLVDQLLPVTAAAADVAARVSVIGACSSVKTRRGTLRRGQTARKNGAEWMATDAQT